MNMTVIEIAQDIVGKLRPEGLAEIKKVASSGGMIKFHATVGRYIRNQYGLWRRAHTPVIVGGVDVSEDHPDAISHRVLEKVWEIVHTR